MENNKKYKILVIDDNKSINHLIQEVLNELGYETYGVYYGKDAINWAKKNKDFIILLDYMLPDMYGKELIEKLNNEVEKNYFIILTGYGDEKTAVEMMKKGALDYIVKEENFIDLIPTLLERVIKEINQKDKLVKQELEIKNHNQLLNNIISNLPNYIFWKDNNLKYLGCNKNYIKIFNLDKPDDIINKTDSDLKLNNTDMKLFKKHELKVLETGKSIIEIEEIFNKSTNSKISLLTNRIPIKNVNGNITGVIFIGTDTSELKEIDESIRTNEARYKELFNNMKSGVAVYETANNGENFILKDLNKAGEKIDKINKNDFIGKSILEIYPNAKITGLFDIIQKVNCSKQYEHELIAEEKNDKIYFKDIKAYKLPSNEIVIVYDDITEKKQNQKLLEEYKLAIESSNDIIEAVNKDYKYIFVNQEFLNQWKFKREKIIDIHIEDIFGKDIFNDSIKPNLDACFKGEIIQQEKEIDYPNKGLRNVLVNYYPLQIDTEKKINIGAVIITRDITNQKQVEIKLKDQYNFTQTLLNTIPNPIFYKDINGKYLGCNKSFENIFNKNKNDTIDKTISNFTTKELAEKNKQIDEELFKNPGSKTFESKYIDKDNKIREAIINKATFNDHEGNILGIIGSMTDITDIKNTEDKFREDEQKIRSIFNSSPDAIVVFDLNFNITDCNKKTLEMIKINNKNDFIGKKIVDFIIKKDRKKIFETIEEIINKNIIKKNEFNLINNNGIEFIGEISFSLICDSKGAPLSFVAIIIDITNRKIYEIRQKLIIEILQLLNKKEENINVIEKILSLIKEFTNIEALGIRLKKNNEFPFYVTNGFSKQFIEKINSIYKKDRNGNLVLECICINLINKKINATNKHCTKRGSFWINNLTELFLMTNELEDQLHLLNKYHNEGYESIIITPLYSGEEIIGILQLCDKRKGVFSLEMVEYFENIGDTIGIALERKKIEEEIKNSEMKFYKAFHLNPNLMTISTLKDNKFIEVNKTCLDVFGFEKNELIGHSLKELNLYVNPEDNDRAALMLQNKGKLYNFETSIYTKTKEIKDLIIYSEIIDLYNEKCLITAGIDITGRKKAEKALEESEERFKELFNNMSNGVAIYKAINNGEDFIFIDFNRGAEKIEKINKDEVIGKSVLEIFPGVKKFGIFDIFQRIYRTGNPEYFPINFYKDNRITGWRENYVYKLPSGELVAVYDDVTKRKLAEDELKKLNEELEVRVIQRTQQLKEANNELESFAYSVSHDLRAPLRHIYGFSELLLKDIGEYLKEKEKKYLNNIIDSAKNMGQLINDILQFSRLGRNKLNYSLVDFKLLVQDSKNILTQEIKDRNITWDIKKLPKINCDLSMMRQVIVNLVSNAVKYTKKRKNAIIEIGTLQKNKNQIIIYIKDNGVGFNMTYLNRLFGVFQRLHSDKEFEGTGIGLAIVKRIITRHGGKIWAESKINKGATFYFSLPLKLL